MNNTLFITFALVAAVVGSPLDWRIVGGETAKPGQFPYQCIVRYNGRLNCGCSIITTRSVLTAAHCVDGYDVSRLSIVTGTNSATKGGQVYDVESAVYHPDWNPAALANDTGIIRVDKEIELSETVQLIELETDPVGADVPVILSGWGSDGTGMPDDLQFIPLATISNEQCGDMQKPMKLYDSEICTLTERGEGACNGDSGGPLVADGKQVGIVSWGRPCALGYPDVFTRVSCFIDWIKENSK